MFLVALVPRLYHVRSPYMNYADHNTSMYAIFARNFVELGLAETRLGLVRNLGAADSGEIAYFAHHPPTISLLAAGSFLLLGMSEAAARALPIAASAASCVLLLLIGRRVARGAPALLGALLLASFPGAVYFGRMLNHESFIVFGGLLCLYCWCRHAETGSRLWWRGCLAVLAGTSLVDWPGAYLAPAVALASFACPATRPRWNRLALQAALVAAGAVLLAVAHIGLLVGSFEDLTAAFTQRAFSTPQQSFTWLAYLVGIRESLKYALTVPGCWLAGAAAAVIVAAGLAAVIRKRRRPDRLQAGKDGERVVTPGSIGSAVLLFGSLHYVLFSNACHFNPHVVYYLLPSIALGVALAAELTQRALQARLRRRAASAVIVPILALPLAAFAREAPSQVRAFFNGESIPGWALMGQALNGIVPEDGALISTDALDNPQFLYYLWRARYNSVEDPAWVTEPLEGSFLLRDLDRPVPGALERALAALPRAETLNFELYDLGTRRLPEAPLPRPEEEPWTLTDLRFGNLVRLTAYRIEPTSVPLPRLGVPGRYLGVPWTPRRAVGRMVHASFVWERLEGAAGRLVPEYELAMTRGGEALRAPLMWWLAGGTLDLSALGPGETFRHEADWLIAEWLDPGDYQLSVIVAGDAGPVQGDFSDRDEPPPIRVPLASVEVAPARRALPE